MGQIQIASHQEFEQYIGQEIGVSSYLKIDQERIQQFAEATLDHQWIHLDQERAKKEGGFGNTIAHGYLTLSILPHLWKEIAEFSNIKMMINYGIEKLRFNQPVVVDSEVRLRVKLSSLVNLRGISKCQLHVTLEIKDQKKPAFSGEMVFLYHFDQA
jgi:acyl dehydratase